MFLLLRLTFSNQIAIYFVCEYNTSEMNVCLDQNLYQGGLDNLTHFIFPVFRDISKHKPTVNVFYSLGICFFF